MYFARVTRGLELVAASYLSEQVDFSLKSESHRTLLFESSSQPRSLLNLSGIDDLFVHIGSFQELDHTRASLDQLRKQLREFEISNALEIIRSVRALPKHPNFTITASFVGKRNYSRWDIADAAKVVFLKQKNWKYIDPKGGDVSNCDLSIRIHLDGSTGEAGVRLGQHPLYKRDYKTAHIVGSLTPQVASLMLFLAKPTSGEKVLDPMCGVGTIPIEAARQGNIGLAFGMDLSLASIELFSLNRQGADAMAFGIRGDALRCPLGTGSVDVIVCDLPWNRNTYIESDLEKKEAYQGLMSEFARILKSNGRAVLLSEESDIVKSCLSNTSLRMRVHYDISLYGRHPTIIILDQRQA